MSIHKSWFQQDRKCYCVLIIHVCVFIYSFVRLFLTFVYFLPFTFSRDSRSFFQLMLLKRLIMQTHHKKAALHFKLLMFSLFVHTHIDMHISWHFCQLKLRGRCFFSLDVSLFVIIAIVSIDNHWALLVAREPPQMWIILHPLSFPSNLNYSAAAAVVFVFHHFFLSFNSKIQSVVLISFKCKCLNFQWQCSLFTIKINDLNSHPIDDIARDKRHRWIKQTNQSGQLRAMRAN